MNYHENIEVDIKKNYCVIGISKKPTNTLTIETAINISNVIDDLYNNKNIPIAIITGLVNYSFSSGSELDEIYKIMNKDGNTNKNMIKASKPVQEAFTRIENSPVITIAAINGVAIGLGTELALVCDIRIMSELGWFKFAQTNIGIIPGAGGTQRLPRIIGVTKAKEFIFTGKKIKAEEALMSNLVNMVVPHGMEVKESINFAENLIMNSSLNSVRLAKKAIQSGLDFGIKNGMEKELEFLGESYEHLDSFEGIKAVMEKRKPSFN